MYNQKYKRPFRTIEDGPVTGKTGSPVSSLLCFLAEFPSGGWKLAEPTNFTWASKIGTGRHVVSPLPREPEKMPVAYVGGANPLSQGFIGSLCIPSYSASFLH